MQAGGADDGRERREVLGVLGPRPAAGGEHSNSGSGRSGIDFQCHCDSPQRSSRRGPGHCSESTLVVDARPRLPVELASLGARASGRKVAAWRIDSRMRSVPTCDRTPTTPSTGGRGAPEPFAEAAPPRRSRAGVDRLLHLPLVPRDGAGELQRSGARRRTSTSSSWRSRSTARSTPTSTPRYLAAASAFTRNLGWPLTVFATPAGRRSSPAPTSRRIRACRGGPRSGRCSTR